jgi:hypothetical protein
VVDIFAAAGLAKPDISILSDEFLAEVQGMPQRNLAVELLQKLLNAHRQHRGLQMKQAAPIHGFPPWWFEYRCAPAPMRPASATFRDHAAVAHNLAGKVYNPRLRGGRHFRDHA